MNHTDEDSQALTLSIEVSEPAIFGLSVIATLRLTNNSNSSITIPARLNLMEGALSLEITGPDQRTRTINGWQADTQLREVTLGAQEQYVAHVNLLQTEEGPVFPEPGHYTLRARYALAPQRAEIVSAGTSVTIRSAKSDAEVGAVKLLENEKLRKSIVLGQGDESPDELQQLAEGYAATVDGKLAKLILSGANDEPDTSELVDNDKTTASAVSLISALRTPYSGVGKRLAASLSAKLDARDSTKETEALKRILAGKPIKSS